MNPSDNASYYQGTPTQASLIMLTGLAISGILNWFYHVVMGWLLPSEQYGVFGVSLSFINILLISISSGFPILVKKFISEESLTLADQHKVVKTSLLGNVMIAILATTIFGLAFVFLLQTNLTTYSSMIYLICAILIAFSIELVFRGLLEGFFKFEVSAISFVIEYTIKVIVAVLLVLVEGKAFYGLLGYLIGIISGMMF
ncbi:MAG: oligosaccharide flippase family protein, partial [Candidatus Hodarchaeota archaeon]